MASRNPKIKRLEAELDSAQRDNNILTREKREAQQLLKESNMEISRLEQTLNELREEESREIRCLKDQINWMRGLIEDLTVSDETMALKLKHREDVIGGDATLGTHYFDPLKGKFR